ncbi:MAG: hypothetical protein AAGA42_09295 [Actinomycetota bacterium]
MSATTTLQPPAEQQSTTSTLQKAIWIAAGMMLAVIASLAFSQAWSATAAPGDDDATYVPIPNCRAFDFRQSELPADGKKTPLGAGEIHNQQITGAVGDCAIPNSAVGVAMNVTVANGTAQSNLRVYPGDVASVPTVSNLNWLPGDAPTPNKVDVKLSPAGTINIYNQNGTVDVIGDIVGYYTSESLQELNQNVEQLFASLPFVVTSENMTTSPDPLASGPTEQLNVTVTAPVGGNVTVDSHAEVGHNVGSQDVFCYLSDSTSTDFEYGQRFEADDTGGWGSVSGTRTFPIAAGATQTYYLLCQEGPSNGGFIVERSMTATFTPAP